MKRLKWIRERVSKLRAIYGPNAYVMFNTRDIDYLLREIYRLKEEIDAIQIQR